MKQATLLISLLFLCLGANAQGIVENCAPFGSDRCANAPIINSCQLDGWAGNTNPPGPVQYFPNGDIPQQNWCNGRFTIENNQWLRFEAIEDHLFINVDVSACSNGRGIQMGAYELTDNTGNCPGEQIACFGVASGQNTSLVFEIEPLEPGTEYLLMIDGFGGDECPFVLDISSGIPPTLEVDATPLSICPGVEAEGALNATITAGSGGGTVLFGWSTENGNIVSGEFTLNPTIDEPGDYTFFAFDLETCCGGFTTINVPATTELPIAQASVIQHIGCTSSTATVSAAGSEVDNGFNVFEYLWSFPNGNPAGEGFELEGLVFPGDYILTVRNVSTGCEQDVMVTVLEDFTEPEITLQEPPIIDCNNPSTFLLVDAPMGSSFDWFSDNGFSSNEQAPMVTETGDYELIVTGANGCTSRDTITVMDDMDGPLLQVQTLVLDCEAPTAPILVVNDNDETTYEWTGINFSSTDMSPIVSDTGTYTLVAINPNGCSNTYFVTVVDDMDPPEVSIMNDDILDCNLIAFTITANSSDDISSYQWSGPNGFNSNEDAPLINSPGIYEVLVTDEKGCTNTANIEIDENMDLPDATLTVSDVLTCSIPEVSISAQSGQVITDYEWSDNLGDENSIEVTEPGFYSVTITGENGCTDVRDIEVTENMMEPTSDAGPDATLTCAAASTQLTAGGSTQTGGSLSFQWSLNGTNLSTDATLDISAIGIYQLIVTDDTNGCTAVDEIVVSSNDDIPEVVLEEISILDCNTSTITLSGVNSSTGSNISYQWLDGDRNLISTNVTIDVSEIGDYIFVVTNGVNGCESELPIQVEENFIAPDPEVTDIAELTCINTGFTVSGNNLNSALNNLSYQWFDANTGMLLSNAENLEITSEGNYNLIITNEDNGCSEEFPFPISINDDTPVADAGTPFTITCAINQANLDASMSEGSNLTYLWLDPNGEVLSNDATTSTQIEGEYTLIVTNSENGCSSDATVLIDTNADFPEIVFNIPIELNCNEMTTTLDASSSFGTGSLSFEWRDENNTVVSSDPDFEVDASGTYTLELTDTDSDCTIQETIEVTDNFTAPIADAGDNGIITCDSDEVSLSGSNSSNGSDFTYEWFNTNNVLLGTNITVDVETPGEYILIVTDERNGCTATSSAVVTPDENIPVVEVDNDGVLSCLQSEVNLFSTLPDNPNYTYTWQNEAGDVLSTTTTFSTTIPGVYSLTAIDGTNGCENSNTILVEENFSEPDLSADTPEVINCINATTEIVTSVADPSQDFEYVWSSTTQTNIGTGATLNTDAAGTYTLTATNITSGCTSSIEVIVLDNFDILTPMPEVSNIIDCNTNTATIALSGINNPNYSYSWTDANGNIVSDQSEFTSEESGTFDILATNNENGCTSTISAEILADLELPVVDIPPSEVLNCQILEVTLTADSDPNFEYLWLSGNIAFPVNTNTIDVSAPGEYQVLVTNPSNGCQNTANIIVDQNINMPQAIIDDLTPLGLSCSQQFVTLDGTASTPIGNVSYQWFDENGLLVSEDAIFDTSNAGTYNLVITDLTTQCVNNITTIVSENEELPPVNIAPPNTLTCIETTITLDASGSAIGSEFDYSWTVPSGATGFDDTDILNPTVTSPGVYILNITNTLTGCENQFSLEVFADTEEPIAQANAEDELDCVTSEVQLNSDGSSNGAGFQRSWIIDGVTLTNLDFVTVQNPGMYTLVVTDLNNGCTSETQVTVTENTDRPTDVEFEAMDITCHGDNDGSFSINQIIGGTAPYTYEVNGELFDNLPTFDNLGPGNYPFLVTDATGCTFETDLDIQEPPAVFVELGEDIEINLGETVFLSANSNVNNIVWDTNGDPLDCDDNCFIQEVGPFTTTTYEVEVMDENGCTEIDNIVVRVRFDRAVYIPSAFSPNGDGINDFFRVFGNSSVLQVQSMLIADRWGEIVYEAENIDLDDEQRFWNGEYRNEDLNSAVHVYYVVVEYIDGRTESFKGDVTIIR